MLIVKYLDMVKNKRLFRYIYLAVFKDLLVLNRMCFFLYLSGRTTLFIIPILNVFVTLKMHLTLI